MADGGETLPLGGGISNWVVRGFEGSGRRIDHYNIPGWIGLGAIDVCRFLPYLILLSGLHLQA